MLSIKEVEHVALLARLALTPAEKDLYARQLSDILAHAQKLQDLNTEDVPPTAHVLPLHNVFRADRPGEHLEPDAALANAPERQNDYFKVPKIL